MGNSRTTRGSFLPHTVKMASLGSSAILLVLITFTGSERGRVLHVDDVVRLDVW